LIVNYTFAIWPTNANFFVVQTNALTASSTNNVLYRCPTGKRAIFLPLIASYVTGTVSNFKPWLAYWATTNPAGNLGVYVVPNDVAVDNAYKTFFDSGLSGYQASQGVHLMGGLNSGGYLCINPDTPVNGSYIWITAVLEVNN
jgi:hypothetical protein